MQMLNIAAGANQPALPQIEMGRDRRKLDPRAGFAHSGEFFDAVRAAGTRGGHLRDGRLDILAAAPATLGSETVGTDGGFLVPPQYALEIFTHSLLEDALLPLCDVIPIQSNGMLMTIDESTPWGTAGVQSTWLTETQSLVLSKPKVREISLRMHKLATLVPLSDELATDAGALNAYLPRRVGDAIRAKVNDAILWGTGAGQPYGVFAGTAPSSLVVAKESGQATQTLQIQNLGKMIGRLPQGSWGRSVFLMNPDSVTALVALGAVTYPMGPPPANFPGNPCGTLIGRPVIVTQHAKAFSSQGDVMLVDLSYYQAIVYAMLPTIVFSLHVYFDYDMAAFRATFRIDGQSKLSSTITPLNGTNQVSPFIQLGAR